jgi:hypothetical protein
MKLEIPQNYPPPSMEEIQRIHHSTVLMDGFLYFHRVPHPDASTVMYASQYIISVLNEHNLSRIVLDFTDRELVSHKLRRLMLQQISDTIMTMSDVAIVINGNPFRKMIVDFFVRTYLRNQDVDVTVWNHKDEAVEYMTKKAKLSS